MKTLVTFTIAITLSLTMINTANAGSMKKFNMWIAAGQYVEVYSKVEEAITENLPLKCNAVSDYYAENAQLQTLPVIEEKPVDEELILIPVSRLMISDYQLANIVSELSQPEQVIDESLPTDLSSAK